MCLLRMASTISGKSILTNYIQEQKRQGGQRQQNKRRGQLHNNDKPRSEGPKREAILDLNKHKGEEIRVRCVGGRQITGILKGFDQLMNLVLEDVTEQLRGMLRLIKYSFLFFTLEVFLLLYKVIGRRFIQYHTKISIDLI